MAIPDEVNRIFDSAPSNQLFDFSLRSCSSNHAEVTMPLKDAYTQEKGVIHGGIIVSLADTAAVYCLLPHLPAGKTMTSIELKINFLRPALPDRGDLNARAQVVKRGSRVAVSDVEVVQGGELVAKGTFTYLVFDEESQ